MLKYWDQLTLGSLVVGLPSQHEGSPSSGASPPLCQCPRQAV
jgi:hypothetical protein